MALRTLSGTMKFVLMESKTTLVALRRGNNQPIFRMFEAFYQMFDIILDIFRSDTHLTRDFGNPQWIILQQAN